MKKLLLVLFVLLFCLSGCSDYKDNYEDLYDKYTDLESDYNDLEVKYYNLLDKFDSVVSVAEDSMIVLSYFENTEDSASYDEAYESIEKVSDALFPYV